MQRKFFGTDGIRGAANSWPMTAEIAVRAGMAAGLQFTRGDHRHRVVIGKDTRLSGYMIEPALTAGFTSVGMDVILVGPMPTPAVAMLTRSLRADLGVMISASHNPFADNGIKLFGPDGYKLSDKIESEIESRMQADISPHLADPADDLRRDGSAHPHRRRRHDHRRAVSRRAPAHDGDLPARDRARVQPQADGHPHAAPPEPVALRRQTTERQSAVSRTAVRQTGLR